MMEVTTIKKVKDLKPDDKVIYIDKEVLISAVLKIIDISILTDNVYIITFANEHENFTLCTVCTGDNNDAYIEDNKVVFFNKQDAIDYLEGLILNIKDEIKNITSIKL